MIGRLEYGKVAQLRDQVMYLPQGRGTPDKEKEFGFITEIRKRDTEDDIIFCRFWRKGRSSGVADHALRTTANSESCPLSSLVFCDIGRVRDIDAICDAFGWA